MERADRARLRILLVEDDHFMARLLTEALNGLGFTDITHRDNAGEGLARLIKKDYELLITDIVMPGMDGIELIRAVRGGLNGAPYNIPILVLTGHSEIEVVNQVTALNIQGFTVKPTTPNQLEQKILDALRLAPVEKLERGHRTFWLSPPVATGVFAPPAAETPQFRLRRIEPVAAELGMVLRDAVTAKGTVLVPAGTRLQHVHLQVLRDLRPLLDQNYIEVETAYGGESQESGTAAASTGNR